MPLRTLLAAAALFGATLAPLAAAQAAQQPPPVPPVEAQPVDAQPGDAQPAHQEPAAQQPPAAQALPRLIGIVVEGARRYTQQQILAALALKVGEPLDPGAVSKGTDTLWRAFHANARTDVREVPGGVELRVTVDEMNVDLEPRFAGNQDVDLETLKRWALLEDRGELYLYQAERVRQRLIEGYRREGYAFIEIDVVKRGPDSGAAPGGALPDAIFEICEGPKVRVRDVVVNGGVSMPDRGTWWWRDGLLKLSKVELAGPWLFNWLGEKYVRETLDADLLSMREVYRDRGWLDAVVELERLEFTPDRSRVTVHVLVDEGQPYTIEAFDIEGVERTPNAQRQEWDETPAELVFPKPELLDLCRLEPGDRYQPYLQQADGFALREHYGKQGYLSHPSLGRDGFEFLEPRLVFDPAHHSVRVTYRLAQGRQRWVREVLFAGVPHTRDRVVRREVDMLPGQVADIEKIRKSLNRLYSTAYFNDEAAPLEHRDPTFTFRPTADPSWVDLEYAVEEGRVVNFNLQGGVDSNNGLFGRVSLSIRNFDLAAPPQSPWSVFSDVYEKTAFHGAGQRLDLDWSPGTIVNSYGMRFLEPDLFRSHFDPWSLELALNRRRRTQRFYDEDRWERRVKLGHEIGRNLALFLGYTNQTLEIGGLDPVPAGPDAIPLPPSIDQEVGTHGLYGLTFDVNYRDLDTFLNPREGVQAVWRNASYGGPMGGEFQFVRSELQLDAFLQNGPPGDEVRPGFHIGLGLGVSDAFGDSSETPYSERFFQGGGHSLRGFGYRGVGPNLGDNALGGESMLSATVEYRVPLYSVVQPGTYKPIETFRLTLFTDAGILDPDPWRLDPEELRWSWGFGLGMVQPFPVIFNFGFPLRTGDGDRLQTFTFSIMNLWL